MLISYEKFAPKIEKEPEKPEEKEPKEIKGEEITTGEISYINKFIDEQKYPDYSKRAGITPETHRKKFDEICRTYDISITPAEMYSEGNFEIKKELGDRVKKMLEENAKGKSLDELRKMLYKEGREYKENYLAYLVQKNIRKYEIRDFLKYKPLREVTERFANAAIFRELESLKIPYGKPKQIIEELKEKTKKDAKKDIEFSKLLKKEPPA